MGEKFFVLIIPEGVDYSALRLAREPDGSITFDTAVLARVAESSGIDPENLDEDGISALLKAWYVHHRQRGGATDPVQEELLEEIKHEDSDVVIAALDATGMSARGLARLILVDERTMRRWISGESPVPGPAVALFTLLAKHPELAKDLPAP